MLSTKDTSSGFMTKHAGVALQVKAVGDDGTIEGYGSVWGVIDSYNEIVEPGAFRRSMVNSKKVGRSIKMLWQHDRQQPIGVWDDLAEDEKGLYAKGRLLKDVSARAAETYGLLKAGAIDGLSIGYEEVRTAPHDDKVGVRRLLELELREISVVTFAANEQARIETVKSILAEGTLPTVRQFEEHLRDAGFSKTLAAAIAGKAAPHLRGDPEAQAAKITEDATEFLRALCA